MDVTSNGVRLHYLVEGSGHPLYIPSLAGTPIYERTFSQRLRGRLQLVFIELRAGRADVSDAATVTFERILDDLDTVRNELGHDRIAVLGHSHHSLLALGYAERFPAQTTHVITVGGAAGNHDAAERTAAYWDLLASPERKNILAEQLARFAAHEQPDWEFTQRMVARYVANGPRFWADPRFDCTALWEGHTNNAEIVQRFWGVPGEFSRYDPSLSFPKVTAPVFIAAGVWDFGDVPTNWQGVKELLPQHTYHAFEQSGHYPHYEEQARFDAALIAWFDATA
jgi:proline iminopeptidase